MLEWALKTFEKNSFSPNWFLRHQHQAWFRIRRAMEIPWYDDRWCILSQYIFARKCFYRFLGIRYNLINNHLSPGAAQYMGIWPKMGLIWPICVGPTYVPLIITKVKGIMIIKKTQEKTDYFSLFWLWFKVSKILYW